MSTQHILTDEDRALFDTPQKRLTATVDAFVVMITEFGLTQIDVDHCREETRQISQMMISQHARVPGVGKIIDDVRAKCDILDAVFEYMRRGE